MSAALNDITWQRLQQFRRRRLSLLKSRGWLAVFTTFIATLLLAVAFDAFVSASPVRWLSSAFIYATTIAVWYWACWRPCSRTDPWEIEALRIEHMQPELREQLLPAVELSAISQTATRQSPEYDSPVFRGHLQQQVAQSIAHLNISNLLPWRIIRHWFLAALGSLAVIVILGLIPQFHFLNRVARALLPAANLDRVDRAAITIEQPQPNSRTIANGDIVAIIARLDGLAPDSVILEQRSHDGEVSTQSMQAHSAKSANSQHATAVAVAESTSEANAASQAIEVSPTPTEVSRFSGAISTEQSWVEYRIKAAGASTAWHRLTARPRPQVIEFQKTLIPPPYSKLAPMLVSSDDGHIKAIVGTKVQLAMQIDQPVSVAELHWQGDLSSASESSKIDKLAVNTRDSIRKLDLKRDESTGRYLAEFTLERSDNYRIYLQATETGFTNEFSPTYVIDAVPDQAPVVIWTQPAASVQVVEPEQILSLAAQVHDELPWDQLTQNVRVNREGEWETPPI